MNALAAWIALDGAPADPATAERLAATLRGHGPDGTETWREGPAVMGFAKFTTTVEQRDEHQPLLDAAGAFVLCLDGRLDNRAELLAWLRPREQLPATATDSALLLALIRHEGEACVQRLVGDYAFACWDRRARRLFCARSPVGWRTLHWHQSGTTLAVATNAKILLALPGVPRRINEGAIGEMLAMRFTTPTETLWAGISILPAGSALVAERGTVRTWRWLAGPFPELDLPDDAAYAEQFNALFDQAIRATMRSAGPVAGHLSGGLDSSSVVCRGQELFRRGAVAAELQPISAVFPGERHDESLWIEAVEAHTGRATTRVTAVPYDWAAAAAWCRESLYLPLRPNTAGTIVATCANLQARGLRVLLTGEGGDDWFAGSVAYWPDWFERGRWRDLVRDVRRTMPGRAWWRAPVSALSHGLAPRLSRARRQSLMQPHLRVFAPTPWIRPAWAARLGLRQRVPAENPLAGLRAYAQCQRAVRFAFPRAYVNFEGVIAYAASRGVELRHPFHDRRLTAFAMALPGDQLLRHGGRKHVLREAMRGTLPELVRTRQSKAAFVTPIIVALAARAKTHPLAGLIAVREGWLDATVLDAIMREHEAWMARGATAPWPTSHLGVVWMAVAVDVWLREAGHAGPR
ncbi:MAG: hypothetical protein RLZZ15_2099 [Verrucomicrobiota bacterium]|jgi:asparagine synthase (glutamine-hydrolysing)